MRLIAAVALLLAVAGCGAERPPEGGPRPDETYGGAIAAAGQDPLAAAQSVGLEGVALEIPQGWSSSEQEGALCVHPPGREDCRYGAMWLYPHAAQRQPGGWPAQHFDASDGWAADSRECRAGQDGGESGGVAGAELATQDFVDHADGRTSHHSVWQVSCEDGGSFEVRLWYLPQSDVALHTWAVDPNYGAAYDAIAASMDSSEYNS